MPPATTAPTATPAPAPAMNSRLVTAGRNCSDPSCGALSAGPGSTLSAIVRSSRLRPAGAPPDRRSNSVLPSAGCQITKAGATLGDYASGSGAYAYGLGERSAL